MESQERERLEREAAAFISSITPHLRQSPSPGPPGSGGRTVHNTVGGQQASNGTVPTNAVAANLSSNLQRLQESEEKRQQALQRLKATHCSVNQEKVRAQGEREREREEEEKNGKRHSVFVRTHS